MKKKEHANKNTASEIMFFHCACIGLDRNTLDSGINIGVYLLNFGFFSRGYVLIKEGNP